MLKSWPGILLGFQVVNKVSWMFWVKGRATGFGRQNVPLWPNDNLSNNTMSYSCTVSVINLVNDFFLPQKWKSKQWDWKNILFICSPLNFFFSLLSLFTIFSLLTNGMFFSLFLKRRELFWLFVSTSNLVLVWLFCLYLQGHWSKIQNFTSFSYIWFLLSFAFTWIYRHWVFNINDQLQKWLKYRRLDH